MSATLEFGGHVFERPIARGGALWLIACAVCACAEKSAPTDVEIRTALMRASQAMYVGVCPCPYSVDATGNRCGLRAPSRKDGGPACSPEQVTDQEVGRYRRLLNPL